MKEKSSSSAILFVREGLTKSASKEIEEQLMYGKYIIVITKRDLEKIGEKTPYQLLVQKINKTENMQETSMEDLI